MVIKIAFFVNDYKLLVPKGTQLREIMSGLLQVEEVPPVEGMTTISKGMLLEKKKIQQYL